MCVEVIDGRCVELDLKALRSVRSCSLECRMGLCVSGVRKWKLKRKEGEMAVESLYPIPFWWDGREMQKHGVLVCSVSIEEARLVFDACLGVAIVSHVFEQAESDMVFVKVHAPWLPAVSEGSVYPKMEITEFREQASAIAKVVCVL